MNNNRLSVAVFAGLALGLAGCGGNSGDSPGSGGSATAMSLVTVSNGFGQILPHTTFRLDSNDEVTSEIIDLRTIDDLITHVRDFNPVRPTPLYNAGAQLPNAQPGNHFVYATFTQDIGVDSVLDNTTGGQASQGLTGAITVVALDPMTGETTQVPGRAFIGGATYAGQPVGNPPTVPFETWVTLDDDGNPVAEDVGGETPGLGFPGTEDNFAGSAILTSPRTFVFVADSDNDLSTHETFPSNRQIRIRITTATLAANGNALEEPALGSSIVGTDSITPEILVAPPPLMSPQVSPGNGDQNVDPMTTVRVEFSEPIQPLSLGDLPTGDPPDLSAAVQLQFGPETSQTQVPFTVVPESVYDLSTYRLTPVFNFPGQGPPTVSLCDDFSRVDISINPGQFLDMAGNLNSQPASTFFTTGEGPGLVNTPVAPEAVYIGRQGAVPGVSVIDLNGYGQTTGNPEANLPGAPVLVEGRSNFPNNPNVLLQGSIMRPALSPGTCTFNGGSSGVFRLTLDSSLNDLLLRPPLVLSVNDMMLGHALDSAFNNGPAPFGCQSGGQNVGGNICAFDGIKMITAIQTGPNTIGPPINNNPILLQSQEENLISWAPHPNPPPLIFPPPCVQPFLNGQEPTSEFSVRPVNQGGLGLTNQLVPGDPFGEPLVGIPPSGLLTSEQNAWWYGPTLPQPMPSACFPYMIRQQVGHFLYVIDRGRREVIVLNSNRMTVIDRIGLPDPTQLAMSPNLDTLAVTNQNSDLVTFIDIDPSSSTFNEIIVNTVVGDRPRGIAWEPGNEDILVCNEGENTVSILSAFSLQTRKIVSSQLSEPFEVAITPRQTNFGFFRNVYFAYILNRNGRVAFFESGPNEVNGWGFDDVIGIASAVFNSPQTLTPNHVDLRSGIWVAHSGPLDPKTETPGDITEGAVTNLSVVSGIQGQLPLNVISLIIPNFRDLVLGVITSIGEDSLSGVPVALAFDNMRNYGGLANVFSTFSAGVPIPTNGKGLTRTVNGGAVNNNEPTYMFVGVPFPPFGVGGVDVIAVDGGFNDVDVNPYQPGNQSIPAPEVQVLMDYFSQ